MEDNNFFVCEFIENYMWFNTYFDFCDRREEIKDTYKLLNAREKRFYRWYVYSNVFMKETFKNAIWEYLNDYDVHGFELMRLRRILKQKYKKSVN